MSRTTSSKEHPELEHRIPTGCVYEAVLAEEGTGTPIRFDVAVSPHVLERLRFCSRRGERRLKYVEDGLLKRAISLQGRVSRLSPESAVAFERLVLGAPAAPWQSGVIAGVPADPGRHGRPDGP
jgi:hypothetical protein